MKLSVLAGFIACAVIAWHILEPNAWEMKQYLYQISKFSRHYPIEGYVLFELLLLTVIMLGIPMVMLLMLLAGILYGFWEAVALVTFGRTAGAMACFMLGRHLLADEQMLKSSWWRKRIGQRLKREGSAYLLMLRLLPVMPDSLVSYGMGATPLTWRIYLWTSFIGMVPLTLLCVWIGAQLGNISALWRFLQ